MLQILYDDSGQPIEAVFADEKFESFIRWVAATVAWEDLPPFWQDAVDRLTIKDAQDEPTRPLRKILAESGIDL